MHRADASIARRLQSELDEESAQILQAESYTQNNRNENQDSSNIPGPSNPIDRQRISTVRMEVSGF